MDGTDVPAQVILTLTGLKPNPSSETGATLAQIGSTNQYIWTTDGSSSSIGLLTSNDGGYYKVELSANHYQDGTWDNTLSYPTHSFNPSSGTVGAGAGQEVRFDFSYASPTINNVSTPQIQPVTFTLVGLRPRSTDAQFQDLGGGKWLYTPSSNTAAQTVYFETTAWNATVSVSMDGDSYYAAGPDNKNSVNSTTVARWGIHTNRTSKTIGIHNSSGTRVSTFKTDSDGDNNSQLTLNRNYFEDDIIYFSYTQNSVTYYSVAYSARVLSAANYQSGNQLNVTISNTTRP